jgi:hypothetical protein
MPLGHRSTLLSLAACTVLLGFGAPSIRAQTPVAVRLVTAPEGNLVRVSVQRDGMVSPGDVAGTIRTVHGTLVVDAEGQPVPDESQFTLNLVSLNQGRASFDPNAYLYVTALHRFPVPLPATGRVAFMMVGDLVIHRITHTTYWRVEGEMVNGGFRGRATTSYGSWAAGPRGISTRERLEFDFHLVSAAPPAGTR